jgi:hypothetical protein
VNNVFATISTASRFAAGTVPTLFPAAIVFDRSRKNPDIVLIDLPT